MLSWQQQLFTYAKEPNGKHWSSKRHEYESMAEPM